MITLIQQSYSTIPRPTPGALLSLERLANIMHSSFGYSNTVLLYMFDGASLRHVTSQPNPAGRLPLISVGTGCDPLSEHLFPKYRSGILAALSWKNSKGVGWCDVFEAVLQGTPMWECLSMEWQVRGAVRVIMQDSMGEPELGYLNLGHALVDLKTRMYYDNKVATDLLRNRS